MEKNFYCSNRLDVLKQLPGGSLAVLFSGKEKQKAEDIMYRFSPDRNFYYLTGLDIQNSILLLIKHDLSDETILFVERPDKRKEMYKGTMKTTNEYGQITNIINVRYTDELDKVIGEIFLKNNLKFLYGDYKKRDFDLITGQVSSFTERIIKCYPYIKVRNVRDIISSLRRIKTIEEQSCLRKAADITTRGVNSLVKKIRPGINTYELNAEFEYSIAKEGAKDCGFDTVITTGSDCLILHYEGNGILKNGELVLVDLGAEYEYYSADICRMYPVNGKFSDLQRYYYETVIEAEEEIIKHLRPGFNMAEISKIGDEVLIDRCRKAGILKNDSEIRNYLNHKIYHFIGLNAHDVGDDCVLEPGMVLAIEPGLYIKELDIGVRVEDNILITEDGNVNLTEKLLKSVDDIECFMLDN